MRRLGAVPLSASRFAVADDEDNVLRVYDARHAGHALTGVDISGPLGIPLKGKRERRAPEIEIEAAAKLGESAFWIGSHGRNSAGKVKQERLRLFATALSAGDALELRGRGYERLLSALIADPRYAPFELATAAELAPKAPGGLNIEGLSARREGGPSVGFRSPLVRGKALLAALLNPEHVAPLASNGREDVESMRMGEHIDVLRLSRWLRDSGEQVGDPRFGLNALAYLSRGLGGAVELAAECSQDGRSL